MRTSNKIIIGILVAPLLMLTTLYVTVYAKYKSGNYSAVKKEPDDRFLKLALTHIISVSVYGLENFTITSAADSTAIEIEKEENDRLRYTISGDSLVIQADSSAKQPETAGRSNRSVKLYLPGDATIHAHNTDVSLKGSKDSLKAFSYRFHLNDGSAFSLRESDNPASGRFFKALHLYASEGSKITLRPHNHIGYLSMQMQSSECEDEGVSVDSLSISADKKSVIRLQGDKLSKLH